MKQNWNNNIKLYILASIVGGCIGLGGIMMLFGVIELLVPEQRITVNPNEVFVPFFGTVIGFILFMVGRYIYNKNNAVKRFILSLTKEE